MLAEGKNSAKLSPPFSRSLKAGLSNQGYAVRGKNTKMAARALCYNPFKPPAFSTSNKQAALPKKNKSDFKAWLENQDAYTMHKPVRKSFLRIPYTLTNLMDVWECDLLDMQSLAKHNDMYRYILSVIDVFSRYLHLVPVKTNSGQAVTSAFRSLFDDADSRRPVWVRIDKGKEFLNKHFPDMLRDEDIQFQVCRNPDGKCAVVERAHRTSRDKRFDILRTRIPTAI